MNEYLEKLRSIATPRGAKAKRTVTKAQGGTVITTETPERVDVIVRPETVRFKGRVHQTGVKKGTVAEIEPAKEKP